MTDLRRVDWKNREYLAGFGALRDGHAELREYSDEVGGLHDTTTWDLLSVTFGDLTEDGRPEALVLVREQYDAPNGRSSSRINVYVFRLVGGEVEQLGDSLSVAEATRGDLLRGRLTLEEPGGCRAYELQGRAWVPQRTGRC